MWLLYEDENGVHSVVSLDHINVVQVSLTEWFFVREDYGFHNPMFNVVNTMISNDVKTWMGFA